MVAHAERPVTGRAYYDMVMRVTPCGKMDSWLLVYLRIVRCILGVGLAFGCSLGLCALRVATSRPTFGNVNRKGA